MKRLDAVCITCATVESKLPQSLWLAVRSHWCDQWLQSTHTRISSSSHNRKESFICGTGTVFNQEILSCDYPDKVDCSASSSFYDANSEMGKFTSQSCEPCARVINIDWWTFSARVATGKSSPEPSNQGGNQGASGRPRPSTSQSPELGGSDVDEQSNQRGDYEPPRGAARPRTPVARPPPSAPRPSQSFESGAGGSSGDQPNLRPSAPVPRPRAKTNNSPRPSTNYRPAAGGSTLDRPASRPSGKTNRARPAAPVRPVVQANDDQILDYEPSQIIQRRVNRQSYTRQQVPRERAFQRRSARWQVMSATY